MNLGESSSVGLNGVAAEFDVTIVIPVRDAEDFVLSALEQACAAAGTSSEIIVVDDGSKDASRELALGFDAGATPLRVLWATDRGGVSAAREIGARHARGRFVWFVDVDDWWPAEALSRLLSAAVTTEAPLVVAQARYLTPAGRLKPVEAHTRAELLDRSEAFVRFLRNDITGFLWDKLIARDLLDSVEFVRTTVHSDQALVAQILGQARSVALDPGVVYRYVQRPGSLVMAGRAKYDALRSVSRMTHEVAGQLDDNVALRLALHYYDLRSIALPSAEDVLQRDLSRADRRRIRKRSRESVADSGIGASWRLGDRRTAMLGLAASRAPILLDLYLRVQRWRARIRR